ncbi:NAD(P)/FAD-dependent oxidoreductase [Brevibacterium album]|uniref:NAD(P)/FAD-dependent oxidoreductase n=1 Tax=Brevibacterium album TaxID=417948 RepID=UPI0003F851E6|nr:NAD(P)/FAD-dependent oxidoreductase [Brevibacterium album]
MTTQNPTLEWDAIIAGGGAAGLSAALMLGRARRRVLVVDAGAPRNRFAAHMHGVLGSEGTPPGELVRRGREECAAYGVQFAQGRIEDVEETAGGLRLVQENGTAHTARALIVATGITDLLPDVRGLAERWGTSVLHCPYCHGWEVADQRLGVLATSAASLHQAQMVRQWSDRVTLFSHAAGALAPEAESQLRARDVAIVTAPVTEVLGEGTGLTAVRTADGEEHAVDAIFTAGTPQPHDGFLSRLGLDRAGLPFGTGTALAVDQTGKTSHGRVWAVGNVVSPMANVPMVIGAGAFTGGAVNGALVAEDFALADEVSRT